MQTGKLIVHHKEKFKFKWYSRFIPFGALWIKILKQNLYSLIFLAFIATIAYFLPEKSVFWMILGIVTSCFTTILLIEPFKWYNKEIQNKDITENIFCTIHELFYILVHMTNPITGYEDNHYTERDYYTSVKGYNNKIEDLTELIELVKEKSSCELIKNIKNEKRHDIENIIQKLEYVKSLLNLASNDLQIALVKFLIFKMIEFFKDNFVEIKNGYWKCEATFLLEQYYKIIKILNSRFFLHMGFIPPRYRYVSITYKPNT